MRKGAGQEGIKAAISEEVHPLTVGQLGEQGIRQWSDDKCVPLATREKWGPFPDPIVGD